MVGKYERNLVLRGKRKAERISREELSTELGLDKVAVCRYELGDRRMPLKVRNDLVVRYGGKESDYRQRLLEIREIHGNMKDPDIVNKELRDRIYEVGLISVEVCKIGGRSRWALFPYVSGRVPVGKIVAGWVAPIVECSVGDLINSGWKEYLALGSGVGVGGGRLGVRYNCAKFSFDAWKDASRQRDIWDVIHKAMGKLSDSDRGLLEERFGFYEDTRTLDSIGKSDNVVRETIRRRQLGVLGRLRFIIESEQV